jgi:hypothetical protein
MALPKRLMSACRFFVEELESSAARIEDSTASLPRGQQPHGRD